MKFQLLITPARVKQPQRADLYGVTHTPALGCVVWVSKTGAGSNRESNVRLMLAILCALRRLPVAAWKSRYHNLH